MQTPTTTINEASEFLASRLDGRKPVAGIILGSGLGTLADRIDNPITVPYTSVPGFPKTSAIGHKGNFICGNLGGKCVLAMQGRYHFYEGYPMQTVVLPVRVMAKLGVKYLFVSNAAGSVRQDWAVGDLMLIEDHINMLPNPLIGPNAEEFGTRFPDMTVAYDSRLREMALSIAAEEGIKLRSGIYLPLSGPSYETPAEYAFCKFAGADTVGMSTTPEVITARHCGLKVLGMSVVTDIAHEAGDDYVTDENEIIRQADAASRRMSLLFERLLSEI